MKRPSFQFYPGDWLNDASLRMVSVGARGLWIEMICIMHQGSEYGFLKVNDKVIHITNLSRMCGATLEETEGWLNELNDAGVYSVDGNGCIYSRRMIRDEIVRQSRAAGGIKGGNPSLLKKKNKEIKVGNKVNLHANLQTTPSSSSSSSSSSSILKEESTSYSCQNDPEGSFLTVQEEGENLEKRNPIPLQKVFDAYKRICTELTCHRIFTSAMRANVRQRWLWVKKDKKFNHDSQILEWFDSFFLSVHENDLMCGRVEVDAGKVPWKADFEWLMNQTNFNKFLSKKYLKWQREAKDE